MKSSSLEKLLRQREQIEARIKATQAQSSEVLRKEDARMKILVGACYIEEHKASDTLGILIEKMKKFLFKKQDLILLESWTSKNIPQLYKIDG